MIVQEFLHLKINIQLPLSGTCAIIGTALDIYVDLQLPFKAALSVKARTLLIK